jgi:hypothetical protein
VAKLLIKVSGVRGLELIEISGSKLSLFILLFLRRMLLGAVIWSLIYKARLRGVRIAIAVAGLIGIRVAITVVIAISVVITISASATTTVVVSTVSELIVIRMESSVSKEGGFAINLLLLLLIRGDRGL